MGLNEKITIIDNKNKDLVKQLTNNKIRNILYATGGIVIGGVTGYLLGKYLP